MGPQNQHVDEKTPLRDGDGEGDQACVAVDLAPLAGQARAGPFFWIWGEQLGWAIIACGNISSQALSAFLAESQFKVCAAQQTLQYSVQCKGYNLLGVITVEVSTARGTTALVYWLINSSLYTGTVQGWWSTSQLVRRSVGM
jgi:hypothetical protein